MMKRAAPALLVLLLLTACNPPPRPAPEPSPRPAAAAALAIEPSATQPFDYYLLNLSWSPEFCHSHPNATECAQRATFVLHGLWPQNTNGAYLQNCSTDPGPRDPSSYSDIYPDAGLLRHEWRTHGTCSGLAPDAFFDLARKAVHAVVIPTELTSLDHQISMPPGQILDLFAKSNPSFPPDSLALSCGNNYLTAIEICMNKTLSPINCTNIRSCRANTVRIPPP
ncbi:ribonuclease T2 family protein [Tunturiibacter lichenicola]|uniref:ribonuclease T2 family protein n=1 Tax=Tunturiibacter lichenicola TaxID=2051959 RepID=UPI003D9B3A2B